jgi:hypothetical protein
MFLHLSEIKAFRHAFAILKTYLIYTHRGMAKLSINHTGTMYKVI